MLIPFSVRAARMARPISTAPGVSEWKQIDSNSTAAVRQHDSKTTVRWSCDWSVLDWCGLDWFGLDWFGLDWFGLDWCGLDWCGLDWCGLDWSIYVLVPTEVPHCEMNWVDCAGGCWSTLLTESVA